MSRAKLLEPTGTEQLRQRNGVCWSHPAYADQHIYARNDRELVCAAWQRGGQAQNVTSTSTARAASGPLAPAQFRLFRPRRHNLLGV